MSQLRELLRIRDFRYLWTAQVASDFGDNLTALSLLIMVQRLTGSTVAIAGLMIAITLPALVLGVVAGVYVDRMDRRKTMIISDVVRGLVVLSFIFLDSPDMVPLIYVVAFVQASIGTLFGPARSALTPRIVGEEKLLAANSVTQTSRIIFNLLGTTAAGILASLSTSFAPAFVVDSLTFLVSAFLISRIVTSGEPEEGAKSKVWQDMVSGFKVIVASRPLTGMLVGAGVAMLGLGAVNVLGVPFLIGELGISEAYFGLVELMQVAGMIIAGGFVAVAAKRLQPGSLVSLGLVGVGAAVALLSMATGILTVAPMLFLIGLSVAPTQAGVSTLSQTLIADKLRGRVGGALNSVVSAANVASMGVAGVLAAAIGIRNVYVLSGAVCVLAGAISWALLKGASQKPEDSEPSPVAA